MSTSKRAAARRAILAVVAALALVLTGCTTGQGAAAPEQANEFRFVDAQPAGEVIAVDDRKDAPTVTGELLDGSPVSLQDDYDGKIVILNFWASWCGPCRPESLDLQQVYETYQSQDVEILGVLVRDSIDQGLTFGEQNGLTYPSIYDPSTKVALQFPGYPLATIPTTLVIDAKGRVAAAYVAPVSAADLTKTIEGLLAE